MNRSVGIDSMIHDNLKAAFFMHCKGCSISLGYMRIKNAASLLSKIALNCANQRFRVSTLAYIRCCFQRAQQIPIRVWFQS